jgi:hypothetical protein
MGDALEFDHHEADQYVVEGEPYATGRAVGVDHGVERFQRCSGTRSEDHGLRDSRDVRQGQVDTCVVPVEHAGQADRVVLDPQIRV